MLRFHTPILIFVLGVCVWFEPAFAEKRVALVIGNSEYQHTSSLRNPANDARLMAATLKEIGFDVVHKTDLGQKDMKRVISAFNKKLLKFGQQTVGLVFYAGHAVQVNGQNYLLPVDANIENEGDVPIEALKVNDILFGMSVARNHINIVILDSCRDNPYQTQFRSAYRGLAPLVAPQGSFIAYATAPGRRALDGDGEHSPFTRAITNHIKTPGLTIARVFQLVSRDVKKATFKKQRPWRTTDMDEDFYPAGKIKKKKFDAKQAAKAIEMAFWASAENSGSQHAYEMYLGKFPKGEFAKQATAKLKQLSISAAVKKEQRRKAEAAQKKREAEWAAERERLAKEREHVTKKLSVLQAQASTKIDVKTLESAFWNSAKASNVKHAYQMYLDKYPKGRFSDKARAHIKVLEGKELAAQASQQKADLERQKREKQWEEERQRLAMERAEFEKRLKLLEGREQQKTKVAALQSDRGGDRSSQPKIMADPRVLSLVLQNELRRVGCHPGQLTGQWSDRARKALVKFNKYSKLNLATAEPTQEAIDAVKSKEPGLCPLPKVTKKKVVKTKKKVRTIKKKKRVKRRKNCNTIHGKVWCEGDY